MKLLRMVLILLCCSNALIAVVGTDPISAYLANPDLTTFSIAVEAASDSILLSNNPNMYKLKLASIAEKEVSRLLSDLHSFTANLSSSELFTFANLHLGRSEYEQAIALYDSLNAAYPAWSCPWRHKGEAYYRLEEFEEASNALKQAIATNIKHYDAYIWLALTLKELEQYSIALEQLDKALELSPDAELSEDKVLSREQIQKLYKELQNLAR